MKPWIHFDVCGVFLLGLVLVCLPVFGGFVIEMLAPGLLGIACVVFGQIMRRTWCDT